jgi:predicted dehydrogenase
MTALRLGLIGTGKHGSRYAQHIVRDMPDLRLVGLARRDVDAARVQAAEYGCRAYGDYRELLAAPDVDAVIVVVPPTLHAEIVEAAAAERRPLLLEKPAAPDLDAGARMLRAVRAAGIPVMVAQTLRYSAVVRRLMDERARLGPIHAVRIAQHFEPSRPGWIDDPAVAGGGITLHTGVHSFDLARRLTATEAERVSCEMTHVRTQRSEDNFSAVIRMHGGAAVVAVAGSRATASRSGAIELAGADGMLIADHLLNTIQFVHGTTVTPLPVPDPVPTVRDCLADFATALRRGAPMPIPLEDGLRAVAMAAACYTAARSGRAAPVAEVA